MIKKGDKIKIKDNVVSELLKLGFEIDSAKSMASFEDTIQKVYDIFDEDGITYVSFDICCEIPLKCCEELKQS